MRLDWEKWERDFLAPEAAKSSFSLGRQRFEEPCDIRTSYQRDRDRIIHSKAFRRLKQKTQVFIATGADHMRTRLTHTLEVAQVSRTIARALRLNEDLVEAIALGHDLGHTPFGHAGERVLDLWLSGFYHNQQSLRVVDVLENNGQGLNLTFEVRDGIVNHSGSGFPATLEGQVVRISDRIAYISHDIDDALRARIFKEKELPKIGHVLGDNHSKRIDTMVRDLLLTSAKLDRINLSDSVKDAIAELRMFLFEKVYFRDEALQEEHWVQVIITALCDYYAAIADSEELILSGANVRQAVGDYIAGMTDRFAINQYREKVLALPTLNDNDGIKQCHRLSQKELEKIREKLLMQLKNEPAKY